MLRRGNLTASLRLRLQLCLMPLAAPAARGAHRGGQPRNSNFLQSRVRANFHSILLKYYSSSRACAVRIPVRRITWRLAARTRTHRLIIRQVRLLDRYLSVRVHRDCPPPASQCPVRGAARGGRRWLHPRPAHRPCPRRSAVSPNRGVTRSGLSCRSPARLVSM